jgi:hypothetical protein
MRIERPSRHKIQHTLSVQVDLVDPQRLDCHFQSMIPPFKSCDEGLGIGLTSSFKPDTQLHSSAAALTRSYLGRKTTPGPAP